MSETTLRFAARSHIGKVRRNNEDSGYASSHLIMVADGMGGHEAGELASAATVGAVVSAVSPSDEVDQALTLLGEAVVTSGEYIADVVARNREFAGMGTTMTALSLRGDRVVIAHIGDSRAYLLRDGELQQLTKDHTFVQSLVDAGQITREQAAVHPRRNLMMRAIDGIHAVDPDFSVREVKIGDRFLICSDGLCGVLDDNAIGVHAATSDLASAVSELIDAVLDAGAPDNITVIVADVVEGEAIADPVVLGAAGDQDTQQRLPGVDLPEEPHIALQPAPLAPTNGRGRLRLVLTTLAATVLVLAASVGWLSTQWYLAIYPPTRVVAIYQGIPVAGLNRLVEISSLPAAELPEYESAQVSATISVASLSDAESTIAQLTTRAAACKLTPTTPGCPTVSP